MSDHACPTCGNQRWVATKPIAGGVWATENCPDCSLDPAAIEAAAKYLQDQWESDVEPDEEFGELPYEWDDLDEIVKGWWLAHARGAVAAFLAYGKENK